MTQTKIKSLFARISNIVLIAILILACCPSVTSAAPIMSRKVVIGSSLASVTTAYDFTFTLSSTAPVKSVSFTPCLAASGACTPGEVTGFTAVGSSLSQQPTALGTGTWTSEGTATALKIKNTGNATAQAVVPVTVKFAGVKNPSATNATFYIRIATFGADDYAGTPLDTGVVASSTAGQVTVSVIIDEKLTFTLANTSVTLTQPATNLTGSGTSAMTVSTNASSGYSVNYTGDTLTSGTDTITPMTVQAASTMNSKQFGINLMSNTTPAIGTNPTGTGSGTPATGYEVQNQFKFNTAGDIIASASAATNDNVFTASYIVNMDGSTAAGAYSTVLTYIATGNF